MRRLALAVVSLVACAVVAGCGPSEPPLYPVSGTVKFADGKPAPGCVVEFTSEAEATKGMNARGEVQPDGSYQLKTVVNGKEKDGAVAGPQKVIVVPPPASSSGPAPLTIPLRYAEAKSSGLTFEVKPGPNAYPVTLERK
jgi:hypothetical protein